MADKKIYQVKKEINGVEYVAQFNGLSCALRAVDESKIDGTDNTSYEKLAQYIFDNVIVEPKGLTPDDFACMDDFNKVLAFGRGVMQGEFRDKANEGTTETKGKR